MNEQKNVDTRMAVTLTVEELRSLIAEALKEKATDDQLLSPEELAVRLRVPKSWVYEQSRLGNLPTHRIGKYIRFRLPEVIPAAEKLRS